MPDRIRRSLSPWPSLLVALGLLCVFVAERLLGSGNGRLVFDVLGGLALLVAVGLRLSWLAGLEDAARRFALAQLGCYGLVLLGLGAYALHLRGFAVAPEGRSPALWYASFALLTAAGLGPLLALELTAAQLRPAGFVEWRRAVNALTTGGTLVLAVAALLAINYAAEQREARRDFSFGAPSSPSEATLALLAASPEPVEVYLFFPRGNRLLAEVLDYFETLERGGAKLVVQDQAVDPELATQLKVTGNGYVALQRGERNAKWFLGTELDTSRSRLKRMDRELRTLFAQLTVAERVIYFTSGHGERGDAKADKGDAAAGRVLRDLVRSLNGKVKPLGLAEGLGGQVPDDAALVVVFGPSAGFLPEEAAALQRYAEAGGHLLLLLDPGVAHGLDGVLATLGLRLEPGTVNHDQVFLQRSHTDADHAFLVTNAFGAHAAVKNLRSARERATVVLHLAGHLSVLDEASPKPAVALKSMPRSWVDLDGNFRFDGDSEQRAVLDLMAVREKTVEGREAASRVAVIADSDVLGDLLVANRPNLVLGYELMAWLLGDDQLGGEIDSEEDVPIQHTRDGDTAWFYGTTFAAPVLVLTLGLTLVSRQRRRRRTP